METTADVDAGSSMHASELASWARERTTEELRSFVSYRHALLPIDIDIE